MKFANNYDHTLDSKNRLFIPAKFRAELGESFYLYYDGNGSCIAIFSNEIYEQKSQEVLESKDADWERFFFSNIISVEPDKQGRITLKASICEDIGLKKDVKIAGVGSRVEIWDAEKFKEEISRLSANSKRFPSVIN